MKRVELDSTVHATNDTAQASFGVTKARLDDPGLDGNADGDANVYSPADLVAAVIDTGIDTTHLDLDEGKVLAFKDLVNGRTNTYDDNGHGTHVAATLAGDGDALSSRQFQGVAPRAALVGVKVLDSSGTGTLDAVIAGIDWVVANKDVYGIEAINLSLGARGCADGTDLTSQAVSRAVAAGIVVAVAAGNDGPGTCTVGTPAAAAAALTVGAMADLGAGGFGLTSFSSRGPTADGRVKPDVVAPGFFITSAQANTVSGYVTLSGTSMATPFVVGVALLMLDANPSLAPQQIKDAITSTAEDWGPAGADGDYGAGRLDSYAALKAAGAPLTAGPDVPAHLARGATLSGTGATIDYTVDVTDLRFPMTATLIDSSLTAGAGTDPDFDLYLYGPDGSPLASSETTARQDAVSVRPTQTGTYTVRVRSYAGTGSFFVDISAGVGLITPTAPAAPALTAATGGYASVSLAWTAPYPGSTPITGYRLYRGSMSGGETLLATLGVVTNFTDTTALNGATYYYQVSAVNAVGEGARSSERSGAPNPPLFYPYKTSAVGTQAEAVAIGDVTGDGRSDVVLTTGFSGISANDFRLLVFAQAADGSLGPPVSYATAATYTNRAESVAIGDLTGDGKRDVVVGVKGVGLQVFQQVSGSLGSPTTIATTNSGRVRLGQLNGDGLLDVVGAGSGVSIFLNNGTGGLSPPVTYTAQAGQDLEVSDVTSDGRDDLVLLSGTTVSVLAQLAAGGFAPPAEYTIATTWSTGGIGVGDVTGDGRNDVVVSFGGNRPTTFIAVLAQTSSAALAAPVGYASYDIPSPVEVADLDGDGRADVVTLHSGWQKVGVYRQQANGTLAAEELFPIPYGDSYKPHGLAVGDVNGDGAPDVVFVDYNWGLTVLRNTNGPPPSATVPGAPTLTAAAPGNGRVDLAWNAPASDGGGVIKGYDIYRGISSGAKTLLTTVGAVTSYTDTSAVNGTTYYYEVSAVNPAGEGARSNERSATPVRPPTLPGAPKLSSARAGDGTVTLTWSAPAFDGGAAILTYYVYRGVGGSKIPINILAGGATTYTDTIVNGRTYYYQVSARNSVGEGPRSNELAASPVAVSPLFQPYQATWVGSRPEAVAIGDVTGDGRNDVVMTTSYSAAATDFRLWVFAQASDGTLLQPVSYATAAAYGRRAGSIAVGDITGDGRNDVVLGVGGLGVQVFPQLASGSLGSPTMTATVDSNRIRLGQLDGDARLDVVGVGWGTNNVIVLLNDGNGGLQAPVTYAVQHDGYEDLDVADVTGDGRDDLVVMSGQGTAPNISVLAQLASGGFGTAVSYRLGSNILTNGIGVGDVTGDGRNDVVASYGGNAGFVAVLAQTASGTLAPAVSYPSYDLPGPVEVADLDLDGRADVVALHSGWSAAGVYRQQADMTLGGEERYLLPDGSPYDAHQLAVDDVNGDGAPDLVAADYSGGLVVLRNTTKSPTGAPGAPKLDSATPGSGRVSLAWSAPPFIGDSPISGYKVYRGTTSGGETLLTTLGTATSYVDSAVANGTTYYYRVSALNASAEGPRSNELTAMPTTVPGAPTLTSATAGNGNVALAWSAPDSNGGAAVTNYKIYRGTATGSETLLATLDAATVYTDTSAANGTTYYYQVTAVNSVGEGPRSLELSAMPAIPDSTPPSRPSDLQSLVSGTNQIALAWQRSTDNVGVSGYRVYRGGVLVATVSQTQYLDSGLAAGTSYIYYVLAVDAAGNKSLASSNLSIKTVALTPSAKSTLAGAVFDGSGHPLANAVVSLALPGGAMKTAKTNASGVWKISNLPPGAYTPTITLTGYKSQSFSVDGVAGKTVLTATTLVVP